MVALSTVIGLAQAIPVITGAIGSVAELFSSPAGGGQAVPAGGFGATIPGTSVAPVPQFAGAGGFQQAGFVPSVRPPVISVPAIPAKGARIPVGTALEFGALAVTGAQTGLEILRELNHQRRPECLEGISAKRIRESSRVCGLDLTAQSVGRPIEVVCQIVASRPRRRSRGISAADLRRTRSTARKINTTRKMLKKAVGGR